MATESKNQKKRVKLFMMFEAVFAGSWRRVVIAILLSFVLSTSAQAAGNWIFDDFEDGDVADGNPFTWVEGPASPGYAWAMMDGDYVLTSNRTSGIPGTTSSYVLESVGATGDVSVRCQLHFLDLNADNAGVSARVIDGLGYYAGISRGGVVYVGENGGDALYLLTDLRPLTRTSTSSWTSSAITSP